MSPSTGAITRVSTAPQEYNQGKPLWLTYVSSVISSVKAFQENWWDYSDIVSGGIPSYKIESRLGQTYFFKNRIEVVRFLDNHQFLVSLLEDAYGQIITHFPYSQSYLEVDEDSEGNNSLLVTIIDNLEPDEAFEILQNFDNNWWLHNLDRAQGHLNIYLELC